jgi:hypothetical protein
VLVDRRFRLACLLAVIREAQAQRAPVKVLVDDYEGRSEYQVAQSRVGAPVRVGRAVLFDYDGQRPIEVTKDEVMAALRDPR